MRKAIAMSLALLLQLGGAARGQTARGAADQGFEAFITGCVTNQEGELIAGATVSVAAMGAWPRVTADAHGRFRYRIPRAGRYQVWASKESELYPRSDMTLYARDSLGTVQVEVTSSEEIDIGDVVLAARGARLLCTLLDAETGAAFDGVSFELCRLDDPGAWMTGGLSTDEKGVLTLLVPAAPVTLRLEKAGYEPCFVGTDGISDKEAALGLEAGVTKQFVVRFKRLRVIQQPQSGSAPN